MSGERLSLGSERNKANLIQQTKVLDVDYAISLPNWSSEQDKPKEGRVCLLVEPGFRRKIGKLLTINIQNAADTLENHLCSVTHVRVYII
jgi:hypothetical protein